MFQVWIPVTLLPWRLDLCLQAPAVRNKQEQRSRPLRSTTAWWNQRLTQGAQITLHPLWIGASEVSTRGAGCSGVFLVAVGVRYTVPSLPFRGFCTASIDKRLHSSERVRNMVRWHLKRSSPHSSGRLLLNSALAVRTPRLGQTLTLRQRYRNKLWRAQNVSLFTVTACPSGRTVK